MGGNGVPAHGGQSAAAVLKKRGDILWPVDKACKGCRYYKMMQCPSAMICDYISIEGKKRPCRPGKDCTVKTLKERRKK